MALDNKAAHRAWRDILPVYLDKRVISVFFMGISQGLPWVMIGSALTLWLKEGGVSRTDIGYAALIYGVYSINFFWSPLVDQLRPPLHQFFGLRKSWILLCQLAVCSACAAMSFFDPASSAKALVLIALALATSSATQDISIDAYRIDSFAKHETAHISAGAAAATAGWWTGYSGIGFIPLALSDKDWSWPALYLLLALIMAVVALITVTLPQARHSAPRAHEERYREYLGKVGQVDNSKRFGLMISLALVLGICLWAIMGSPGMPQAYSERPSYTMEVVAVVVLFAIAIARQLSVVDAQLGIHKNPNATYRPSDKILAWVLGSVVEPIKDFFSRNPVKLALAILAFIFLFKIGEAFLGRMSIVFYKEVGFSNTDIAKYSKMLTWWLTISFSLLGGLINARFGIVKGLAISGCAMAGSNLMFAWIAQVGPHIDLYIATIVIDGFAQAWSTVAFVSFISMLCSHSFSATQYALLASLASLGRNTLSAASGLLVDWLDGNWSLFFVITTVMVIPSLALLFSIRKPVAKLEAEANEGLEQKKDSG